MPVSSKPKSPICGFGAGGAGGGASATAAGGGATGSLVVQPARMVVAARPIRIRFIWEFPSESNLLKPVAGYAAKAPAPNDNRHAPTDERQARSAPRRCRRRARHLLRVHCIQMRRLTT